MAEPTTSIAAELTGLLESRERVALALEQALQELADRQQELDAIEQSLAEQRQANQARFVQAREQANRVPVAGLLDDEGRAEQAHERELVAAIDQERRQLDAVARNVHEPALTRRNMADARVSALRGQLRAIDTQIEQHRAAIAAILAVGGPAKVLGAVGKRLRGRSP